MILNATRQTLIGPESRSLRAQRGDDQWKVTQSKNDLVNKILIPTSERPRGLIEPLECRGPSPIAVGTAPRRNCGRIVAKSRPNGITFCNSDKCFGNRAMCLSECWQRVQGTPRR